MSFLSNPKATFWENHRLGLPFAPTLTLLFVVMGSALILSVIGYCGILPLLSLLCSCVLAFVLIPLLLLGAFVFTYSMPDAYPTGALTLLGKVHPELQRLGVIQFMEQKIIEMPPADHQAEIQFNVSEFMKDTRHINIFIPLMFIVYRRNLFYFLSTVFMFSLIGLNIALLMPNSYVHNCTDHGNYLACLLHNFYYHITIFQSIGDISHSPDNLVVQALAIIEAMTSFFFFVIILGGGISAVSCARAQVSPEKVGDELAGRLSALCSDQHPMAIQMPTETSPSTSRHS
jgi:hypothetical protein